MQIRIEAQPGPVLDQLAQLGDQAPLALTRALNKSLVTAKTAALRAVAADMGLLQKYVERSIVPWKASFDNQVATLYISGFKIPLQRFHAAESGTGLKYRLPGGRGFLPGGFIAKLESGHIGAFTRAPSSAKWIRLKQAAGKPRRQWAGSLPIEEAFGPSVTESFKTVSPQIEDAAMEAMRKNLVHEIGFLAKQLGFDVTGEAAGA